MMPMDPTVVEEIYRELTRARDAVAKDDEYAVRYHLKEAYTYGLDLPGFIDHAAADTTADTPTEVRRLWNALQGALVCPPEDRGDFSTQALDASNEFTNAVTGDGNGE